MSNYLVPSSGPLEGEALEDVFHDVIQGVCGLSDGSLIRPRWQPEPPNQPSFPTDWIAFGLQTVDADRFAYVRHDPSGSGSDIVERDETLKLLVSFYGPSGQSLCSIFRDGIQIEQNRFDLSAAGIKLVEVQEALTLPTLLHEKWVKRRDVTMMFRRRVTRVYAVGTILSATGTLNNEQYLTIISVPNQ